MTRASPARGSHPIKVAAPALKVGGRAEHLVKEISKTPHSFSTRDIFAKIAEDGSVIPAGTKFAAEALKQWFKKLVGRDPTPDELDKMMSIWGGSGHIEITP